MDTLEIQRVRGTNDVIGRDAARQRGLADRLLALFELYGYQPVQTPVIENLDLFLRKSGEEIAAHMYSFTHWNRQLCLRPDHTASVMRAYVNHLQDRPLPVRLAYTGPSFRYDKPQRGRYRQFTEVGVECIGGVGPAADAEILRLATRGLDQLGVGSYRLLIGHLGVVLELLGQLGIDEHGQALIVGNMESLGRRRTDREALIDRILALMGSDDGDGPTERPGNGVEAESLPGLLREYGPAGAARVTADLLDRAHLALESGTRTPGEIVDRLLAKASRKSSSTEVRTAAAFIARLHELAGPPERALPALAGLLREHDLDPAPLRELEQALALFGSHGGRADEITVDLSLGRGLRYYTGLVFEAYHDGPDGALQLCGGGRYDDLVRALGGRAEVPAVGFSYGLERLDLVLGADDAVAPPAVDVLVAPLDASDLPLAAELAEALRDDGVRVELELKSRGARGSLRHADRTAIPLVVLVGERERAAGEVVLREMASRLERRVAVRELTATVKAVRADGTQ